MMHCPSGEPTISFSLASHRCAKLSKSHLGIGKALRPIGADCSVRAVWRTKSLVLAASYLKLLRHRMMMGCTVSECHAGTSFPPEISNLKSALSSNRFQV